MGDVSYTQIKSENILSRKSIPHDIVCEDCGSKWTAMLIDIPVCVLINDLDEYSRMLCKNILVPPDPPLVLYVFRPSDRELMDTKITLSCVVPSQSSPLQWIITHNAIGLRAPKGCQIMPKKCETHSDIFEYRNSGFQPDVTIKEEELKIESQEDFSNISEIGNFNSSQIEDNSEDSRSNKNISGKELMFEQATEIHNGDNWETSSSFDPTINPQKNSPLNKINRMHVKRNFIKTRVEQIDKPRTGRHEAETKKSTLWGATLFKDWLKEKQEIDGIPDVGPEFEHYSKDFLDDLLSQFYVEIRTTNNTWYSKSSYICLRAAIQRHLRGTPFNLPYILTDDIEFRYSNEVLAGIFNMLSREGLVKTRHHNTIEQGDLDKLKASGTIGTQNPLALQRLVWLNIALHGSKRGRENYRNMSHDMFKVCIDADGRRYVAHTYCKKTKNNQDASVQDSCIPQGRIYEIEDDELCPVKVIELYKSLLNTEIDCFWQRPNKHFNETGSWFMKVPLGVNYLGNMMKDMCKAANISNIYTNHCTRITSSVILKEDGFNETDIIKVTGHKSTKSHTNYKHRANTSIKRDMSDAINQNNYIKTSKIDNEKNYNSNIPITEYDNLQEPPESDNEMFNAEVTYK